jgi:hypothetical protein
MNDQEMDSLLHNAAPEMPSQLLASIRAQIHSDTRPATPLMGAFSYVAIFAAVSGLVSIGLAAILQFKGLHALSVPAAAKLSALLLLGVLFSSHIVGRGMRPATGPLRIWLLGGFALASYDALIFHLLGDYSTTAFIHSGMTCLGLGALCGLFTALPLWLLVRRGFVVEPLRTGAAIGLLSGLSGLTFLTLHCDNLTVPHDAIWHAAVLVLCMAAGALVSPRLKP